MGYDFEILYQHGLNNKATDALSRLPPTAKWMSLMALELIDVEKVKEEVVEDP